MFRLFFLQGIVQQVSLITPFILHKDSRFVCRRVSLSIGQAIFCDASSSLTVSKHALGHHSCLCPAPLAWLLLHTQQPTPTATSFKNMALFAFHVSTAQTRCSSATRTVCFWMAPCQQGHAHHRPNSSFNSSISRPSLRPPSAHSSIPMMSRFWRVSLRITFKSHENSRPE